MRDDIKDREMENEVVRGVGEIKGEKEVWGKKSHVNVTCKGMVHPPKIKIMTFTQGEHALLFKSLWSVRFLKHEGCIYWSKIH